MTMPDVEWGHHFLLAGVGSDAPLLSRILEGLPPKSYGQLLLEDTTPFAPLLWEGPARMQTYWVRPNPAVEGEAPEEGELLAEAIRAWAEEWLPEGGCEEELPVTIWIGGAGHARIDELCRQLLRAYPMLHLHHMERVG